jgi:hypothetical protein
VDVGTNVRFINASRFDDWQKGDLGIITKELAMPPQNLNKLFIVQIDNREVWATDLDIEPHNQLALF